MKLIKFETANCMPCKMVDSLMNDKNIEVDERIDISIDPETVKKEYGVMTVPVLMLLDEKGAEIARASGFNPPEIEKLIAQL